VLTLAVGERTKRLASIARRLSERIGGEANTAGFVR